jgi:aspartate/methionine/tyrosine aminotransferase
MNELGDDDGIGELLKRHAQLEVMSGDKESGNWLSGWQCVNPWIDQIRDNVSEIKSKLRLDEYHYLSEDDEIRHNLFKFHTSADPKLPQDFLCGAGSSTLIFTFCAWLRSQGVTNVHYVQPMFYTVLHAMKLFGITARPINGKHGFEAGFRLELPADRSVLLITDPIWYAGIPVDSETIGLIRDWQHRTNSLVFVDGSFQYARWDGALQEATAEFDPAHTFRILCPTKALAAHGFRFAYAAVPSAMRSELAHLYSNIYGSATIESLAFGRALSNLIVDRHICHRITDVVAERHKRLRSTGAIQATWQASCGYFIYEKINAEIPDRDKLFGGGYFQQRRYSDHFRINLLSPSIGLLG